jgi:hypothetical protein
MGVLIFVLLVVGVLFFVGKSKAEGRMTYADTKRAIRAVDQGTAVRMPSWSTNEHETLVFFDGVRRMAERTGVLGSYVNLVYSEREPSRLLLLAAGEMEAAGRSFVQQQLGVSELLLEMWNRFPESGRRQLSSIS